jgi:hypothetical protein
MQATHRRVVEEAVLEVVQLFDEQLQLPMLAYRSHMCIKCLHAQGTDPRLTTIQAG